MEAQIKIIAIESIQTAMSLNGKLVTLEDFFTEMNRILDTKTFDKEATRDTVAGLVNQSARKICPAFFDFVTPKACMDAKGNYTTQKARWV